MIEPAEVKALVAELRGPPFTAAEARRPKDAGGVPPKAGIYAWWMRPGALPEIEGPRHPTENLELLYVGISPEDADSKQDLRKRVCGKHLGGNTGGSTFRLALAALLWEREGWEVQHGRDRPILLREHNRALNEWQQANLRVRWAQLEEPWDAEDQLIEAMQPPLNQVGNKGHQLYGLVHDKRLALRARARAAR